MDIGDEYKKPFNFYDDVMMIIKDDEPITVDRLVPEDKDKKIKSKSNVPSMEDTLG